MEDPGSGGRRRGCAEGDAELDLELDCVGGVEHRLGVVTVILEAAWNVGGHFAKGRMVLSRKITVLVGNGDAGWKLECGPGQEVGRRGRSAPHVPHVYDVGEAFVLMNWNEILCFSSLLRESFLVYFSVQSSFPGNTLIT